MAQSMTLEVALRDLEAGKFSYRMVDTIKDHIDSLALNIEEFQACYEPTHLDILRRDLRIYLLEKEVRSLNTMLLRIINGKAIVIDAYRNAKYEIFHFINVDIPFLDAKIREISAAFVVAFDFAAEYFIRASETCWRESRLLINDISHDLTDKIVGFFSRIKATT